MASREQNEAVAGLLRRSLARDAASENCPEPDLLAAYYEHSLEDAATTNFDRHLSGCPRCREQLAAMVRAETPKPQPKTSWLLDWRLLSAAAVVMVIVTVLFIQRPERNAPVPQTASAPLVAVNKEGPKSEATGALTHEDSLSAVPSNSRGAASEAKPIRTLRPPVAVPQSSVAERIGDKKVADAGTPSNAAVGGSVAKQSANNQVAANESADAATAQQSAGAAGGGQGYGVAHARAASIGHGVTQQQVQQQSPASPQPALAQLSAPQPAGTPQSAPAQQKTANASSATPAASSETVEVTSDSQPQAVTKDKQRTEAVTSAFTANNDQASLQILEERNRESVIDTPIPSVKWRITAAGFVERSEDGGATWSGQEPDPEAHLIAGSAPTDKVCWLVGKEGVVLVTKDAANWKKIPPPATTDITSVSAKNASSATVTTADGRRFTTNNEGKKWKPVN